MLWLWVEWIESRLPLVCGPDWPLWVLVFFGGPAFMAVWRAGLRGHPVCPHLVWALLFSWAALPFTWFVTAADPKRPEQMASNRALASVLLLVPSALALAFCLVRGQFAADLLSFMGRVLTQGPLQGETRLEWLHDVEEFQGYQFPALAALFLLPLLCSTTVNRFRLYLRCRSLPEATPCGEECLAQVARVNWWMSQGFLALSLVLALGSEYLVCW